MRRAWSARCSTTSAASTSRASTPSPASAARRTRTSTATASIRPGRPGVLRHPAQPPRLPHLLLPLLRGRQGLAGDARRLHALPGVHGRRHRDRPARAPPRPTSCRCGRRPQEFGFPDEEAAFALQYGHGVGLSHLGEADLQPPGLPRPPGDPGGGDGVRARDLLAGRRRLVGGPDRGGGRRHRRRVRGDHQVPGRGPAGRGAALLDGRRVAADDLRESQSHLNTPAGRGER